MNTNLEKEKKDDKIHFEALKKMEKFKKGDVNLLLFFLVSALFVFGMSVLWSKNWLIDERYKDYYPVFISKSTLEKKANKERAKRQEDINKSLEIYNENNESANGSK